MELATHIEMTAGMLRLDAIRLMKAVLAGTSTNKFHDVMEGAFGGPGCVPVVPAEEKEEDFKEDLSAFTTPEPSGSSTSTQGTKRKLATPVGIAKKEGRSSLQGWRLSSCRC